MYRSNRRQWDSWVWTLSLVVASVQLVACNDEQDHPARYTDGAMGATPDAVDPCASPNEGCTCEVPGEVADCGQVKIQIDNYSTCYEGSRLCAADGMWGACMSDQQIVKAQH